MQELNRPDLKQHDRTLEHLLLRYTQALITQIAQTSVCNRHHSITQQLCRWLLQSLDRLSSDELIITQEMIASMLGVRREGVTEAARKLQQAGLIDYHRGHITVLDRRGLETQVCECYQVVKKEYDCLLPYQTCEDCAHWRPNNSIKNGVGVCLIDMRTDILKWPCLTACEKFSVNALNFSTRKDPVPERTIRLSHG